MKPTLLPPPRLHAGRHRQPALERPLPAAFAHPIAAFVAYEADHDFLVPNPRPDLTIDAHTLRMLALR